jgi:hypothetical protein
MKQQSYIHIIQHIVNVCLLLQDTSHIPTEAINCLHKDSDVKADNKQRYEVRGDKRSNNFGSRGWIPAWHFLLTLSVIELHALVEEKLLHTLGALGMGPLFNSRAHHRRFEVSWMADVWSLMGLPSPSAVRGYPC